MIQLYQEFWTKMQELNLSHESLQNLITQTEKKLIKPTQGDYPKWKLAYDQLPEIISVKKHKHSKAVSCQADISEKDYSIINDSCEQLIPWRKGPFDLFSIYVDAEWQSDMKWNRIKDSLPDLKNKVVLDVGCGNGYYMFRMKQSNPYLVMGIDPGLLQIMQFWSVEKYIQTGMGILPLTLNDLPRKMQCFDVAFSMGVLYHRKSPLHHIKELFDCIKPNGYLVLETLVVEGGKTSCLVPEGRYAQMRNVWFLPSVALLSIMLERNGFNAIQCIDVTTTTIEEQRTTQWMKFHSLEQFLSTNKCTTIEGHPLPMRATLVAKRNG